MSNVKCRWPSVSAFPFNTGFKESKKSEFIAIGTDYVTILNILAELEFTEYALVSKDGVVIKMFSEIYCSYNIQEGSDFRGICSI